MSERARIAPVGVGWWAPAAHLVTSILEGDAPAAVRVRAPKARA